MSTEHCFANITNDQECKRYIEWGSGIETMPRLRTLTSSERSTLHEFPCVSGVPIPDEWLPLSAEEARLANMSMPDISRALFNSKFLSGVRRNVQFVLRSGGVSLCDSDTSFRIIVSIALFVPELLAAALDRFCVDNQDEFHAAIELGCEARATASAYVDRMLEGVVQRTAHEDALALPGAEELRFCNQVYRYCFRHAERLSTLKRVNTEGHLLLLIPALKRLSIAPAIAARASDCPATAQGSMYNMMRLLQVRAHGTIWRVVRDGSSDPAIFTPWLFPSDLGGCNTTDDDGESDECKLEPTDVRDLYNYTFEREDASDGEDCDLVWFLDYLIAAVRMIMRGYGWSVTEMAAKDTGNNGWDGEEHIPRAICRSLRLFLDAGTEALPFEDDADLELAAFFHARLLQTANSVLRFLCAYDMPVNIRCEIGELHTACSAAFATGRQQMPDIYSDHIRPAALQYGNLAAIRELPADYKDHESFSRSLTNQDDLWEL